MDTSFPATPTQDPEVHRDGDGWKEPGDPGHSDSASGASDASGSEADMCVFFCSFL